MKVYKKMTVVSAALSPAWEMKKCAIHTKNLSF